MSKNIIAEYVTALLVWHLFFIVAPLSAQTFKKAGDFQDHLKLNKKDINALRSLKYRPEGEDFVCINGKNRFTRALYGGYSTFRIETSDRPVFASYSGTDNQHIAFKIQLGKTRIALDSMEYCKSVYKPGRRDYELKDKRLGDAVLRVSVQAFFDKEGAIWKFELSKKIKGLQLVGMTSEIGYNKLDRSGDLGVRPADTFEMPTNPVHLKTCSFDLGKSAGYMVFDSTALKPVQKTEGEKLYAATDVSRLKIANTLKIKTPDAFINTLGGTIAMAADGDWDGKVWSHGCIGWRMPLTGWRAAYMGDVLGWHDRSRIHFDNYAASQVTDVKPIYPHPQQDTALNMTRALKKWGTPMYSNGYICRNPQNNKQIHHYDMNLVYIDELLWHLKWTGDLDYARKIFPTIKLSLEWEKRNWDPDNDGLYEAYAATWASDALMYNSGGTTVGSAYNYRANKIAAEIATLIGEDPAPYQKEAETIFKAINKKLWLKDKGWWAEFVDFMGNKMVHPDAGLWTIYTAIDSDIPDIFQAYQATRYVDKQMAHIPVKSNDLKGEYYTLATTNWMPYNWSLNNVTFGEVGHTALAYWQAGRPDEAFKLFKSAVLDGMYLGNSPANIGQISYYDAALGEIYRDFGDVIGVYSRDVVQGLFGIIPDALHGKLIIRPGFPAEWNFAEINQPDVDYKFERKGNKDFYNVTSRFPKPLSLNLQVNAIKDEIIVVKVNGKSVKWTLKEAINTPLIEIPCEAAGKYTVEIEWGGKEIARSGFDKNNIVEKYNPQNIDPANLKTNGTIFEKCKQGQMTWWNAVNYDYKEKDQPLTENYSINLDASKKQEYVTVKMDNALNAAVTDIFRNRYMSPRSPFTTMQTPAQGVGEWCQPKLTYKIDDKGFREAIKNEIFETPFGVPFRIPAGKNNIAFTTLWDNYPDSIAVPLSGKAKHAYLLMAGTTQPMQYGITNGAVTVYYTDGTTTELILKNPETWCPIQEDYYTNGYSFKINAPRPYRVLFKSGIVSRDMEKAAKISKTEVSQREIVGGAGVILDLPLDNTKELKSIQWKSVANEVIVGMMAVTLL